MSKKKTAAKEIAVPFREQLFGLGSQDPGSQAPDPSKLAQDPKEKDCPGCLELLVWRTASKKDYDCCYDEGMEAGEDGAAAAAPSSSAVAADSPASVGDESSPAPFVTPVLATFVPKTQHLARCPKKPVRNSRRQGCSGSWSNWSSGYHNRSWAAASGTPGFFNGMAQLKELERYEKKAKLVE